jgi:ABC-type transporter Mla MlaB component
MEHKLDHDVLHLSIRRDVLSTGVRELFEKFRSIQNDPQVREQSWNCLELDLTGAKMIDSMGLNFVVQILKWAKERNAKAKIRIHDKNLDRLLRFTRMNEHAEVVCA